MCIFFARWIFNTLRYKYLGIFMSCVSNSLHIESKHRGDFLKRFIIRFIRPCALCLPSSLFIALAAKFISIVLAEISSFVTICTRWPCLDSFPLNLMFFAFDMRLASIRPSKIVCSILSHFSISVFVVSIYFCLNFRSFVGFFLSSFEGVAKQFHFVHHLPHPSASASLFMLRQW